LPGMAGTKGRIFACMSEPAPESRTLALRGEHITLAQAIKAIGLAGSGGQAKFLVREGGVTVNGEPVTQPGRKLRAGDRFGTAEEGEWTITG
jgi:ribosome-associated protein